MTTGIENFTRAQREVLRLMKCGLKLINDGNEFLILQDESKFIADRLVSRESAQLFLDLGLIANNITHLSLTDKGREAVESWRLK